MGTDKDQSQEVSSRQVIHIADLMTGSGGHSELADDDAVRQAVALNNRVFFETMIKRYGSWDRFMEEMRRRAREQEDKTP